MFSEKGKPLQLFEGFKFRREREAKCGVSWRCTDKNCKARIYTDTSEKTILTTENVTHNHLAPSISTREKVANVVKQKALLDISSRPMDLIRPEIANLGTDNNLTVNDVNSIRHSIYRKRRTKLPALPKFTNEVHDVVDQLEVKSHIGEDMTLFNDPVYNIICFSTDRNVSFLCSTETILADGTFDYCTKFFVQLFTIHAFRNGHYVPLIWALLPSKTVEVYRRLFEKLVQICDNRNLVFQPKTFVADFEIAIRSAAKLVWSNITMVGCRFHLGQAWYRKIQECGLSIVYKKQDTEISKWLRLNFGLSFLKPEDVAECFVLDVLPNMPADKRVFKFVEYLLHWYIYDSSQFPPSQWAAATADSQRTTNACESFHSSFGKNFNSSHPNIYVFIEALKATQITTHTLLNSVEIPKTQSKASKKVRAQKDFVEECLQYYNNYEIDGFSLIKKLSHKYAPS